ncbi:O-antigen ligase family protein [Rhodococcus sp. MEB041]|uniref:O-antigen ligase family protein n=1 Tax=Rhodococcus sp. MEB041 TaxID=3040323 RepID=UPI0025507CE5|nr:O-antigen ligase family protein [Rhodococcus sp. MEB041]
MLSDISRWVESTQGAVMLLSGAALLAWWTVPRKPDALPRTLVLFTGAFTFGSLLSGTIGLALQAVALICGFTAWIATPVAERRGGSVVKACALLIGFWTLLMFHPNVPDFNPGLLGFRKTALAFGGIVLGCAIARRHIRRMERLVIGMVTFALAISLFGYFYLPEIAELVPRAADQYTSNFRGTERLQGVFSGPFHVAGAGLLVLGWAAVRRRQHPVFALIVGVVGSIAVYYTYVRSAYVAIVLLVIVLVISSATPVRRLQGVYFVCIASLVGYIVLSRSADNRFASTILSISDASEDGRFQNRFPEWREGLRLIGESPIFGWGAGSAGDTLGRAFRAGEHVTPHNIALKFSVEGGLIGVLLVIAVIAAVRKSVVWTNPQGQLAAISAVGLIGMGLTGSAIDTPPISYLALVLVGLAVGSTPDAGDTTVAVSETDSSTPPEIVSPRRRTTADTRRAPGSRPAQPAARR